MCRFHEMWKCISPSALIYTIHAQPFEFTLIYVFNYYCIWHIQTHTHSIYTQHTTVTVHSMATPASIIIHQLYGCEVKLRNRHYVKCDASVTYKLAGYFMVCDENDGGEFSQIQITNWMDVTNGRCDRRRSKGSDQNGKSPHYTCIYNTLTEPNWTEMSGWMVGWLKVYVYDTFHLMNWNSYVLNVMAIVCDYNIRFFAQIYLKPLTTIHHRRVAYIAYSNAMCSVPFNIHLFSFSFSKWRCISIGGYYLQCLILFLCPLCPYYYSLIRAGFVIFFLLPTSIAFIIYVFPWTLDT